jgi:3-phenylpropionate/trans-cinnamate dioxygenase ferredoxin reductase subunit
MADREVDFLLIGGGVASASCAKTLREEGAEGSILIVGREADPPYQRPPLSKTYLAGKMEREDAYYLDDGWAEESGVEVATRTSVMKLDTEARVAKLSTKEEVGFGKALIATGANVRRLRVEGSDLDGLHYLRAFGNAEAIREDAHEGSKVVLIGGSYIACELAATLTGCGCDCSLLMLEEVTLERHFGPEAGAYVKRLLSDHGVGIHGADELDRFEGAEGRVTKVVSKGGLELEADCVVLGTGVVPDVMVARQAGLELGEAGGVACSAQLETSVPGIFAAGDVAEWDSPLHDGPTRIEHFEVAVAHGKTAARNMLGQGHAHDEVPYFWSDLSDWATLEYVGVGSGDSTVARGSIDDGDFTSFYLDGDRVVAALTVGRSADLDHARRLIKDRATPDRDRLADDSADLGSL